ncbi:MAG: ABC transporter substrate-binding protein [Candidatus Thorarchaeota archaeon]
MGKKIKYTILLMIICTGLFLSPISTKIFVKAINPGPFFSICILCPNTNPARNQWATLIAEQLPKIGIAVDVFDHTGWAQISPRVWGYPGPYPIPTYPEGGYDVLFVSWSWGLDWDPTGLFDSAGITPDGDNFYQYSNPEMDWAIANYTQSFVLADRIDWCEEIQAILYEDLPSVVIVYDASVFPMNEDLIGWNPFLWGNCMEPMTLWEIPGQTEFHYATPAYFEDFHPMLYDSIYDAKWLHQIYNGLIERDASNNNFYGPWLAESYSSSDGLTYTVNIRNSAVWADGTALTTDDIIYNYQLALMLPGSNYSPYYWSNDSITKINDHEFTIEFNLPYVFQDRNLALDLIPKHIWESVAPEDHTAQAVEWATNLPAKIFGFGPFMLEEYDATNQIIHLTANEYFDDWYGSAPKFDDVYFEFYGSKEGALAALAAGEIDMVDAQFSPLLDELDIPGATYTIVEGGGVQEMAVNCLHPWIGTGELCPISSEESGRQIRQAMSHIIPREIIVEEILNGLGSPGITPCSPITVGFDDTLNPYEYNINEALIHMAYAGFDVGINITSPPVTSTPPSESPTTGISFTIGISFSTILSILSLMAGCILIIRKKKE